MVSHNGDAKASGTKGHGIGVTNYAPPKENYSPKLHNPSAAMRKGANDAFNLPSLCMGSLQEYWGSKE